MPKLDLETLLAPRLLMLIYGEPGVGKTTLCGSVLDVPDMCPVLWCELDGGIKTLRNKLLKNSKNITVLSVKGHDDLQMMEKVLMGETPFKTVVIDSLTELYWLMMRLHFGATNRSGVYPEGTDYRLLSTKMIDLLRNVRDKGNTSVLATADTSVVENRISGDLYWGISLPGQLTRQVPKFFDILGYLSVDLQVRSDGNVRRTRRKLQVQPFGNVHAKTRVSWTKYGAVIDDPTMPKIYDDYQSTDTESEISEASQIVEEGDDENDTDQS